MKKELLKKLKLGVISLSAIGLLAACGTDNMEEDPGMDEEPGVEEPAEDPAEEDDLDDVEDDDVGETE